MKQTLALFWLGCVLLAGVYLSERVYSGLHFHTDLMALLPQDQQNPDIQATNDKAIKALLRHIVLLVGATQREEARSIATTLSKELVASNEVDLSFQEYGKNDLQKIGTFYYPYREGLLSEADRQLLLNNKGEDIAHHALSRAYGSMGLMNADMLHADPYFLLANFFTSLPVPASHMQLDEGMLTAQDEGKFWVIIAGQLRHDAFALSTQDAISAALTKVRKLTPQDVQILPLGSVFYAQAGAQQAMHETSLIGTLSTLGVILLVGLIFRSWAPTLLSLLAIAIGILVAFSVSLWIFGELHVGALLFGTSLIGVAVDYSLQYCCEIFSPQKKTPDKRLQHVVAAITLGASTTIIGYMTFLLAPFPGLHQIAIFSAIGLFASWLTVVAWFPFLDRTPFPRHGKIILAQAQKFLILWENPQHRRQWWLILSLALVLGAAGFLHIHKDDDVHHMQSLNPALLVAQEKITKLIGKGQDSQFFTVQASNEENALQLEEKLIDRLIPLSHDGSLKSFQAMAQYIPSAERQMENRALVRHQLYGSLFAQQVKQLNLSNPPTLPNEEQPVLVPGHDEPSFSSALEIDKTSTSVTHIVMLDGIANAARVAACAQGLPGVHFVDPAGDFSSLIGKYRERALYLIALSALLMVPLLIYRYGFKKGLGLMIPPGLAVLLTPAFCSLLNQPFTFFDAMALVLVLSIGVDYAIFLAETSKERRAVTMLAVFMAASTALLSFGLLALSDVTAIHHFGMTMLIGIAISCLLSPMARLLKQND